MATLAATIGAGLLASAPAGAGAAPAPAATPPDASAGKPVAIGQPASVSGDAQGPDQLRAGNSGAQAVPQADNAEATAHHLQEAINRMRLQQGRPPLRELSADLAGQNRTYLQHLLQSILASGRCEHDQIGWRAFQASLSAAPLHPSSQVIACGRGARGLNDEQVVAAWLTSPVHRTILLDRPRATSLGCSDLSQRNQSAVSCILWSPGP
ncbi:MAG: CAP domain-containing protein [Cyanobium sp.]